jgi:hypothetical protein
MVSVAVPDAAEKKTELVEVTGENWRTVNWVVRSISPVSVAVPAL